MAGFDRQTLRRAVLTVAALNLAYFGIEFTMALRIDSVSLFADSVDFLEDAAVNLLIAIGLAWSVQSRARLGRVLAVLITVPGIATVWVAWQQWQSTSVPEPAALSLTGAGALVVNVGCAFILAKVRHMRGSLTRAAFLSARNDAAANVAIVAAGGVAAWLNSKWPDLLVGIGILIMNLDAMREVLEAAREESAPQS